MEAHSNHSLAAGPNQGPSIPTSTVRRKSSSKGSGMNTVEVEDVDDFSDDDSMGEEEGGGMELESDFDIARDEGDLVCSWLLII